MQPTDLPSTKLETPQGELADQLLLQRASANDQVAFEMLVHRYQHRLYRFVSAHLGNDQAQDVVQFVLLQLYLALPKLSRNFSCPFASLKPWLFRVALNRCIDEKRRWRRRQTLLFSTLEQLNEEQLNSSEFALLCDPTPRPDEQAEAIDQRRQLSLAIKTLSPTPRAIVWLRYMEDLPFDAIASRLGIPTATAKTAFYRACARLRSHYQSEKEEASA